MQPYRHNFDNNTIVELDGQKQSLGIIGRQEFLNTDLEHRLLKFGLTNAEVKVLLFLTKHGPRNVSDIAKRIGMLRTEAYAVLRSLQNKGVVAANAENTKFAPIPLDKAIDFLTQIQKQDTLPTEEMKESVMNIWSMMQGSEVTKNKELGIKQQNKFQILVGFDRVFCRAKDMVSTANTEILIVANGKNMARLFHTGVTEDLQAKANKGVNVQILTSGPQSQELLSGLRECLIKKMRMPLNPETFFITIDNEQLLLIGYNDIDRVQDTFAIWINCKLLTDVLTLLLTESWNFDSLGLESMREVIMDAKNKGDSV